MLRFGVFLLLVGCAHSPPAPRADVVSLMLRHVKADGPNHRHMLRLARLVPAFSKAEGASSGIVEAAVLLHDATKEDGSGTPYERFCTHHEQGAALAKAELPALGYASADVARVAEAIEQHMGPCGEKRFMTSFCKREYPSPTTPEARVLFDLDMLDLMTVDGVVKVVTLRQRNAEFAKEPVKDSALTGADSAWKSVTDARQVLVTKTGQACGDAVQAHTKAFLDGVDFAVATTVEAFEVSAKTYLSTHPLPACVTP